MVAKGELVTDVEVGDHAGIKVRILAQITRGQRLISENSG